MPIPGPGQSLPITTIVAEFGGTAPHEISEYYRGGALVPNSPNTTTIPTSGTIAYSNFYNTSATTRVAIPLVISAPTDNYDVYANRGPTYNPGNSDITVTVNPGVIVGSSSTAAYAMLVPSCFSPADTITIINNSVIQGKGGAGGTGSSGTPRDGATGGNAIFVNRPTVITNNGTVAGGGGGGGGGGANFVPRPVKSGGPRSAGGGGGGGGAGAPPSAGGGIFGSWPGTQATAGGPGTSSAGGTVGGGGTSVPTVATGGPGGAGGGRGAAGGAGTARTYTPSPPLGLAGAGGGAGNYIVGNPFVTWPVTGTRSGGVA